LPPKRWTSGSSACTPKAPDSTPRPTTLGRPHSALGSGPCRRSSPGTLYPNQVEAVTNLEQSLRRNRPRALIQMATGSGKTKAAITAIYRLIKFGGARRVLFLVDRTNLGEQAEKEFQAYRAPGVNRKFAELYNVQRLASNSIMDSSRGSVRRSSGSTLDPKASPTSPPPRRPRRRSSCIRGSAVSRGRSAPALMCLPHRAQLHLALLTPPRTAVGSPRS
jgi:hypothetical protein